MVRSIRFAICAMLATGAVAQTPYRAAEHTQPPPLFDRLTPPEFQAEGQKGTAVERSRSPRWQLGEHRRLSAALARVGPGRPGVVDAFVLSAGIDSDPVFGREAREAGRVLARRYGAATRAITLAGTDGSADSTLPMGSPQNISASLARMSELMGPEDVLVLYATGHGAPFGLVYNDGDSGFGIIGPARLGALLDELGIRNRLLLISACYSGVFVGPLITPTTAIVTAAATDRTSFGCKADNDWTYFGDALVNRALRQPVPFATAAATATDQIGTWEAKGGLTASLPQSYIGAKAAEWLAAIEKTLPPATAPVGRPATDALKP